METSKLRCKKIYLDWKRKVLERDKHTCKDCSRDNFPVEVHHIKELGKMIKGLNLEEFPKEVWDLDNAITLCRACHFKRHGKIYI